MKWSLGIILTTMVIMGQALASWQPVLSNQPSEIKVTKRTLGKSTLLLKFELPGFHLGQKSLDNFNTTTIAIPGTSAWREQGYPELPRLRANLAVPNGALVQYQIVKIAQERHRVGVPYPSKGDFVRTIDPALIQAKRGPVYFTNTIWPAKPFEMNSTFQMRKLTGATFNFNPVQYKTETEELIVTRSMTVQVRFRGAKNFIKGNNLDDNSFVELYKSRFLNYNQVKKAAGKYSFIAEKGRVAYIVPKKWEGLIKPLTDWKTQTGFTVETVTIESLNDLVKDDGEDDEPSESATYQDIKAFIQKGYDERELAYVVLVGDSEDMPFHPGKSGNARRNEADPMYALVDGSDSYPDLFISRISGETDEDIKNIVARTVNYEKNPDVDGDWYGKGVGIASNEGSPKDWERANDLKEMLLDWGFSSVDDMYDPDVEKEDLITSINEGRGFINYIGHGSTTSWVTTGFNNNDIDKLENGSMLPFIVTVACVNGNFGGREAFAERWLKAGSESDPRGAIAVFASSTNQSWVPPTVGQKEITRLVSEDEATTIGGLFFNGVMAVLDDDSSSAKQTFETWHIFGDATLQVRTKKPTAIDGNIPLSIAANTSFLTLDVKEAGIAVGVMQDGELVSSALSNEQGGITLDLEDRLKSKGPLTLTLTGYNKIPLIKKVSIK